MFEWITTPACLGYPVRPFMVRQMAGYRKIMFIEIRIILIFIARTRLRLISSGTIQEMELKTWSFPMVSQGLDGFDFQSFLISRQSPFLMSFRLGTLHFSDPHWNSAWSLNSTLFIMAAAQFWQAQAIFRMFPVHQTRIQWYIHCILLHCYPTNAFQLWWNHAQHLSDDYHHQLQMIYWIADPSEDQVCIFLYYQWIHALALNPIRDLLRQNNVMREVRTR